MKKDRSKKSCRSVIELHHIIEKAKGGEDHLGNMVPLCSTHHSMVHEGWIKIDRWYFSTAGWVLAWKDHKGNIHYGRPKEPYFPMLD